MDIDVKISNKLFANWIQHEKDRTPRSSKIYSGSSRYIQYSQSINVIFYIKKLKDKNHMITSINAEKALAKIQQ